MVADHHAAAGGRRLFLTLKGGGRAIPPVTGHVCYLFLFVGLNNCAIQHSGRNRYHFTLRRHCNAARPPKRGALLRSFLALRAPEGRASVLDETLYDAAATRGLAFLALAVIDLERMLEIAEFARGLAMIPQRRTAGLDRLVQHRRESPSPSVWHDRSGSDLFGRQRRGQPARRQLRAIQRLADIDVAKPRHHALVEQRRLEAGLLVGAGAPPASPHRTHCRAARDRAP